MLMKTTASGNSAYRVSTYGTGRSGGLQGDKILVRGLLSEQGKHRCPSYGQRPPSASCRAKRAKGQISMPSLERNERLPAYTSTRRTRFL